MKRDPSFQLYSVLSLTLLVCVFLSLAIGDVSLKLSQLLHAIFHRDLSQSSVILWEIRMPRTILGILVGASLGLAGAGMQGLLRNPLAEPGVLGVTGGAVLGAVIMLYSGISLSFPLALPLGGMVGAFVSVLLLYLFGGYFSSVQTLILVGVAINTLAFSLTSLALNLSSNPYAALDIVFWQMGALADRSYHHVFLALPFIASGLLLLFWDGRALNALTLGEETASSLGVRMRGVRTRLILGTALAVGASVSVCGSIGFIGLVVPHLMRPFVGHEPARLLGASALGGSILLLLADILVRVIPIGTELKLGVVTSLIGAPFFIMLIFKMRKKTL